MYEPRTYQDQYNRDRFACFRVAWKESELLIGTDHNSASPEMEGLALGEVKRIRYLLDEYINLHPEFLSSHLPVEAASSAPAEVQEMCRAGKYAGTGPMAAVAGLFAETVGQKILTACNCHELFVENGGDIFFFLKEPLLLSVYAGASPLSQKFGIELPAGRHGVCTSSGTHGHSFSYGKADAVSIACESAPVADALATAVANMLSSADDILPVLDSLEEFALLRSVVIILGDKLGVKGAYSLKPI